MEKEKIRWNKVYGISCLLNIGKYGQRLQQKNNLSDYSSLSTTE